MVFVAQQALPVEATYKLYAFRRAIPNHIWLQFVAMALLQYRPQFSSLACVRMQEYQARYHLNFELVLGLLCHPD